jgi:hypothetical protein
VPSLAVVTEATIEGEPPSFSAYKYTVPVEGVTVPVKVGVVTLVKLSVLLGPLSEPADRSGPDEGVDGGESRVKVMLSVPI